MTTRKNTNCSEFIEFLDNYVDYQLSSGQRQIFDDHLTECEECVAYMDSYKKSIRLLKSVAADEQILEDAPSDLIRAILATRVNTAKI